MSQLSESTPQYSARCCSLLRQATKQHQVRSHQRQRAPTAARRKANGGMSSKPTVAQRHPTVPQTASPAVLHPFTARTLNARRPKSDEEQFHVRPKLPAARVSSSTRLRFFTRQRHDEAAVPNRTGVECAPGRTVANCLCIQVEARAGLVREIEAVLPRPPSGLNPRPPRSACHCLPTPQLCLPTRPACPALPPCLPCPPTYTALPARQGP